MEDIYDNSETEAYVDGVVGGVILAKWLSDNSDSTYQDGVDNNGNKIDYTGSWKKFAPPKEGLSGCIAKLVGINSALIAIASIVILIITGIMQVFNL